MRNISLFIAAALMTATMLLIAFTPPKKNYKPTQPATKVNTSDSKIKIDEAKRNSIMRRFMSYTNIENFH